ncbi:MAG: hypothetical protein AB7O59_02255 [Pirellulales bacterium]
MPRRIQHRTLAVTRPPRSIVWLLFSGALVAGCGLGITPEHQAALAKVQQLGGKINSEGGGYKLVLTGTQVEDADLEGLQHVANLTEIDLRGTRITDAGLPHLQAISTLKFVRIERTNITREGADRLEKSRPDLDVMR